MNYVCLCFLEGIRFLITFDSPVLHKLGRHITDALLNQTVITCLYMYVSTGKIQHTYIGLQNLLHVHWHFHEEKYQRSRLKALYANEIFSKTKLLLLTVGYSLCFNYA